MIPYAMLLGHVAPYSAAPAGMSASREWHHPAGLSRSEHRAMRLGYIVQVLREEGPSSCAELAVEFGVRVEAIYKDLMQMKARGVVDMVCGSHRPALWAAVGEPA